MSLNQVQHEKHFSWKITRKICWRNNSQTFSKRSKWINSLKFCTVCFVVYLVEDYWTILTLTCKLLAFTSAKVFLKFVSAIFLFFTKLWTSNNYEKNSFLFHLKSFFSFLRYLVFYIFAFPRFFIPCQSLL